MWGLLGLGSVANRMKRERQRKHSITLGEKKDSKISITGRGMGAAAGGCGQKNRHSGHREKGRQKTIKKESVKQWELGWVGGQNKPRLIPWFRPRIDSNKEN